MTPSRNFDPAAWQPEITMEHFTLANGLTLFVLPDHRLPIVSLQIHYKVGSRHELPGITGISHLFEHLMFRGTETLGPEEFSRLLQAKGGEINAFTTRDHTSYFENLPAEHLELGLELEADRLLHLKLDDDTFQPERQVVISERKLRSVDSPFGLVEEQLCATAYTQHPYNWPVVGWNQDLHRMTLDDCLAYYRSHYHPARSPSSSPEMWSRRAPGTWWRNTSARFPPRLRPRSPRSWSRPSAASAGPSSKKVSQVEALLAGFHIVGIDHPDLYPLNLLAVILSGGKASRFHQEFVRVGKAIALEVELAPLPFSAQDPDLLVITAVATPGRPAGVGAGTLGRPGRLHQDGVSPMELARAKKLVRSQAVRSLAHNFFRGLLVGLFHLKTGDATLANQILSSLEAVTEDDILRVARTYLREDNRTVVVLKPVTSEESEALGTLQ